MKRLLVTGLLLLLTIPNTAFSQQPRGEFVQADNLFPKVKFVTNLGEIVVELDRLRAPITVNNFLSYVIAKRYDNTVFHRLEQDFIIQGGGYDREVNGIEEFPAIVNESGSGLKNDQFTLSMARLHNPHSATSQFFFNLADNKSLDPGRNWGYSVFGSVVEGEAFFEKLVDIETDVSEKLGWPSFPTKEILLISVTVLDEQ